ncbi:MAG: aminoacyl-tRNA hydrolase [Candidatus Nanopelagicales bacterium]
MTDSTWLVVGLGNIDEQYQKTRHNVGVMAIRHLAESFNEKFSRHKKTNSFLAQAKEGSQKILMAYLDCYMNESGGPTQSLMQFFNVSEEHLVILHDELDLDFENLRIKFAGGDNGHNGLKSIRAAIGNGEFHRVRLGIGRPKTQQDPASFVLEKFSQSESSKLEEFLAESTSAIQTLMRDGLSQAQNLYHKRVDQNE